MRHKFRVTIDPKGAFEVPLDVRAIYGHARPAVKMTTWGKTYRTRIMVYGGKYYLGLWKAVRDAHGLRGGETFDVTIEPDSGPRTVTPPKELAAALKRNPTARAG